jgi:histidinol dehydrogenase
VSFRRHTLQEWQRGGFSRRGFDLAGREEQAAAVRAICRRVALEGDSALLDCGAQFGGWTPGPNQRLQVSARDLQLALDQLSPDERAALEVAASRIRAFHEAQTYADVAGPAGLELLTRPIRRVGLYAPGGGAAYPSTVLMTAIPARLAGVREIALATPPNSAGEIPGSVLAAACLAGVDELYRMGGAQAIAAYAYGTESVPRVDLIAGPGSIWVTLAKREVFGSVGIDGIAGPTEIMIVADRDASAEYVAADLASQLEHDPMAWAVLVTDSESLADAVDESMQDMLRLLDRRDVIAAANGSIVVVKSLDQAIEVVNEFGPEHLEILTADPESLLSQVENAGAVFLGEHTPVSLGDYVIGTNHTLPTAQTARFASPLGVHTFLRRTSVARITAAGFFNLQASAQTLARMEGLTAHARALEVRRGNA